MRKTKTGIKYSTKRYSNLNANFTQIANDVFKIVENGNQFMIYCYLCYRYNNKYQYAFPSLDTIVKDTSASLSTIRRCIKDLERLGLIKIDKLEKSERQEYTNNVYYVYYPIVYEEEILMKKVTEEQLRKIEEGEKDYYIEKDIFIPTEKDIKDDGDES